MKERKHCDRVEIRKKKEIFLLTDTFFCLHAGLPRGAVSASFQFSLYRNSLRCIRV